MWARTKHTATNKDNRYGFTIVELLIVIVVIGILAAITIVAYNGVQNRANDTAVQNDLRQFAQKMEIFRVDDGLYPNDAGEITSSLGIRFTKSAYKTAGTSSLNAAVYCRIADGSGYAFIGLSKSGTSWVVRHDHTPRPFTTVNYRESGLPTQSTVCPAILPGASTSGNQWAFSGGAWNTWVED